MPEQPEVQAHAERLASDFVGATLQRFRALNFTALKTFSPAPEVTQGKPITGLRTRGKFLIIDQGEVGYVIHLMQGGRLRPDERQSAKPRGGLARWTFDDGRALLLTEAGKEHSAGVWVFEGSPFELEPLTKLGPDAHTLPVDALAEVLATESMRLHGFLRRQRLVAGIGRRLANEICHRAKLSPFITTKKLTATDIKVLHTAIADAFAAALAFEREQDEIVASKLRPGRVHNRTGEPCEVCGDTIREIAYNRYTVHYCATCQTGGKILADNTTSKFLK